MPRKNLTTDIVHLFRANTPKLLRDHLKKRGSASTSAYEFAMTTASRSLATAPLGSARSRLAPPSYTTRWDGTQRGEEFSSSDVACHVTLRLGVIHAMEG